MPLPHVTLPHSLAYFPVAPSPQLQPRAYSSPSHSAPGKPRAPCTRMHRLSAEFSQWEAPEGGSQAEEGSVQGRNPSPPPTLQSLGPPTLQPCRVVPPPPLLPGLGLNGAPCWFLTLPCFCPPPFVKPSSAEPTGTLTHPSSSCLVWGSPVPSAAAIWKPSTCRSGEKKHYRLSKPPSGRHTFLHTSDWPEHVT